MLLCGLTPVENHRRFEASSNQMRSCPERAHFNISRLCIYAGGYSDKVAYSTR
jgi:hypothetical protein